MADYADRSGGMSAKNTSCTDPRKSSDFALILSTCQITMFEARMILRIFCNFAL